MSPFRSQAQRKYMFAKFPKIAEEFAKHTPEGRKLPKYAPKKVTGIKRKGRRRKTVYG